MSWYQSLISIISAVLGGFIGGWVVAYRMGRWRQSVEDRIERVISAPPVYDMLESENALSQWMARTMMKEL